MKKYSRLMIALVAVCLCFGNAASAYAKNAFTETQPMNVDGYLSVLVTTPEGADTAGKLDMATGAIAKGDKLAEKAPCVLGVIPKATAKGEPVLVLLLGGKGKAGAVEKGYGVATIDFGDKKALVAVAQGSKFDGSNNLDGLNAKFPGTADKLAKFLGASGTSGSRLAALDYAGDSILEYGFATIKESDRRPLDKDGNPNLLSWPTSKNLREAKD